MLVSSSTLFGGRYTREIVALQIVLSAEAARLASAFRVRASVDIFPADRWDPVSSSDSTSEKILTGFDDGYFMCIVASWSCLCS